MEMYLKFFVSSSNLARLVAISASNAEMRFFRDACTKTRQFIFIPKP
jgi:hypothetical protein